MALDPHLRLSLLPDGHVELVDVPEGRTVDDLLDDFLHRRGPFEADWVRVRAGGGTTRYVRLDQVAQVDAQRD